MPKDDLEKIRHSCEHVFAQAIKELYGDNITLAVAHISADGFANDAKWEQLPSPADLPIIEKKMQEIIQADLPIVQKEISIAEARKLFANNHFKLEWAEQWAAQDKTLTVYWTGDKYVDLCKGPHVASTGAIKAFKLMSVAGAYWRADENNEMLTRISGVAFNSKKDLAEHLHKLEEAKQRDHRKLGKELDLFVFSDLVGAGLPLWTPKGTILREELNDYVWQLRKARGYEKVTIPHITKKDLYETSGHWAKFKNELFKITTREGHEFAMKPMNCPHHTQIFAHLPRSYKDMPQRYAETTMVYRDEQTGELSGLSRVRCITQDDAHVFCRSNQIKDEFFKVWDIVEQFYSSVGFPLTIRLSFHDPKHFANYLGTPEVWQKAETALENIAKERGAVYKIAAGEAAMYGPKIDFISKDSLGREWQVATIQLDMNLPERFDLFCINEQGEHERIVMIHCAIMGSIERFSAIMIEHFAGNFPVWLAPVQVQLLTVSEKHVAYCENLAKQFTVAGIRVTIDSDNETIGKKIRKATQQKIPYLLVTGDKEIESGKLAIRKRGAREAIMMDKQEFVEYVTDRIKAKSLNH
ncbi:MAG: threonine--tRNA ligase [Patescibacteria group bacterium]|jgi:threonyl-tRNA synthetase